MKLFNKKNYLKLLIVPLIALIIFLILIFVYPGIEQGIDLRGGNQIIVHYDAPKDYSNFESTLREKYQIAEVKINEVRGISDYGLLIEFSLQSDLENAKSQRANIDFTNDIEIVKEDVKNILVPLIEVGFLEFQDLSLIDNARNIEEIRQALTESINIANNNFYNEISILLKTELNLDDEARIQTREIAPTLGKDFINSSLRVGLTAIILLIIVILLFFRQLVPSALIIFAVFFAVFSALAGMAIFNIPLSLTTIPALLMLIGYSVDTDILLSTRILKDRSKDPFDSANSSLLTGLTMTGTTMATIIVMLVISYFTQMLIIFEISLIIIFGLIGDIISTWFFNAPALIKYVLKVKK